MPYLATKINKTTKPNQTKPNEPKPFQNKECGNGSDSGKASASARKRVNGIWLDWIRNWIWVRINAHIGLSPGAQRTKHYLGAAADIAQKQNINRFYRHWYISVYQLISITSKCLCHDNRLGFYSLVFRCLALPCHVYFMSALCQNRLNTQKPKRWGRQRRQRGSVESMELHARIVCANEK